MRVVYLTLGVFILFNIGAACRTPAPLAANCEPVSGGLIHCSGERARGDG